MMLPQGTVSTLTSMRRMGYLQLIFSKALTAQSKSVQMMGKLHLDLFCQEKYLLNHVNLKIKLRRSRDVFALMADADTYKIKIKDLALFVRYVQLSPAVNTPSDA